jgi:ABC-2 type transport system permease protein
VRLMNGIKRFWILFKTELNAWRHDPITTAGGIIPPTLVLIAFGLLFGGKLLFEIGVINRDEGPYGRLLVETIEEVNSPFGIPYYEIFAGTAEETWDAYDHYQIEGVWVIPADFSARVQAGENPQIEMHFNNYNDDRAKNHRIYSAEILWAFYKRLNLPGPPMEIQEIYPRPEMVHWFPIIGVGIALLGATLGGIFNMYALTHKEHISGLTLEFALMPRSLVWVLGIKVLLAVLFSILTGTFFLIVLAVWLGVWAGRFLWLVWLLFGLVALYWIALSLIVGLRARNYMAGAIGLALSSIIVFFISGGLSMVRVNVDKVVAVAWLFPNTYAVDPLRDLILFETLPRDLQTTLIFTIGLALLSLTSCWILSTRQIRYLS